MQRLDLKEPFESEVIKTACAFANAGDGKVRVEGMTKGAKWYLVDFD